MSNRGRSLNHDKYNSKCVCAICTCGTHKCPQKPHSKLKLDSETTNQAFYQPHQVTRQGRFRQRPAPTMNSYDPQILQSSYKNTYKGLPLLSEIGKTPRDDNTKFGNHKKLPFEGSSTYKSQFLPNDVRPEPRRRFEYQPSSDKFMGESQYKQNFQKQHVKTANGDFENKSYLTDPTTFQNRKRIPFQGQSSYKSEFKDPEAPFPKRKQYKYQPNTAKFEGQSTYKSFYPKYTIVQQVCPIIQLPKVPRQPSVGKTHINYVAEKNTWQ